MKIRVLAVGLLGAVLALGGPVMGPSAVRPAPAVAATPLKIMLAGDSITQGFDGDYTWRYRLDRELRRQQVGFDFVGPYRFSYGGANHYAIPSGWDTAHDATGGTRLKTQIAQITADMANYVPDVLVALYGTTDLLPRKPGENPPTVSLADELDDIETFVDEVRQVNGKIDIVLGEVTTRRVPNRIAFNNAVNALAKDLNLKFPYTESHVVVADLDYNGWSPTAYTYDTTHPNPNGEGVIAQRVALQLRVLGRIPQFPRVPVSGLAWRPNLVPLVKVYKSKRVLTSWSSTKYLNKPQMVRVKIKRLKTGSVRITPWTYAPQYVTGKLKAGRYQVSIQGRRQEMYSGWSRVYTVRIR